MEQKGKEMKQLTKKQADWLIGKIDSHSTTEIVGSIPVSVFNVTAIKEAINRCTDPLPMRTEISGGYVEIKRNDFNDDKLSIGVFWQDNSGSGGHAIMPSQLVQLYHDIGELLEEPE